MAFGIAASARTGLKIRNVDVSGCRFGAFFSGCTDIELSASEIHHNEAGNIYLDVRNRGIVIADCHIHHNQNGHGLSVYAPANGVRAKGPLASIDVIGDGLARFGIEGVDLSKVREGTLTGQNAEGSVANPSMILLFADETPGPDAPPLPGGSVRLPDGRDWYSLSAEPRWGGKPYSPDGKLGQFRIGDVDPAILRQAKSAYVAYLFDESLANRDIQVLRNEVDHARVQGIWAQHVDGILIEGNRTHHNGASGIQIESLARRVWLENNVSFANGVNYNHETGIWLDETVDAVVQGNLCYENQKGMGVTQGEWVIVRRNLLVNNRAQHAGGDPAGCRRNAGGFWFSGGRHYHLGAPPGANNNAFVHNTLVANGAEESMWGGFQHGAQGYPSPGANVLLNNLFISPLGEAPIDLNRLPAAIDGNIYWAENGFRARVRLADGVKTFNLSEPDGLRAYRAATGLDANSRIARVQMVDPDDGGFSLAPGSAGVGEGLPLARTTNAGTGRKIPVDSVVCFSAGLLDRNGEIIKPGDSIRIGKAAACVTAVDRERSILTVDADLTWRAGEAANYSYQGDGPDVGA